MKSDLRNTFHNLRDVVLLKREKLCFSFENNIIRIRAHFAKIIQTNLQAYYVRISYYMIPEITELS